MENGIKFKCSLLVDHLQYLHCFCNKAELLCDFLLTGIISIQDIKTDVIKPFFRKMRERNCIFRYCIPKHLTWKNIRPGNGLYTDRW